MFGSRGRGSRVAYVVFICLLIISVIGCSTAGTPSGKDAGQKTAGTGPKKGGTITVALDAEPDTLDVQKTGMSASSTVASFIGDELFYRDPQTGESKPHLAESYTISEDGKTWTFKIRPGVKFHDGTPMTAKSFKETFERALAPETASVTTGPTLSLVASITAPDDNTLVLQLKEPSAPLLPGLASPGFMQPLSMAAVEKLGKDYGRNPVGEGPWKFESWLPGQSITLVRNEDYKWANKSVENQGPPHPDKLVFKFIHDHQVLVAAFESGTVDIASIQAKDAKKFRNNDKYTVLEGISPGVTFIGMNLTNEFLKDINVRKAMNMAINKEALIQADLQGEGVPAYGPLPRSMFGYDKSIEEYAYKYNLEEAKKLLDASGWKENAQGIREKDGKQLRLRLTTVEGTQGNALIQNMLKQIGIDVKIETGDRATMLQSAVKGTFDLIALSYTDSDPDAVLYSVFHSSQIGQGFNFGRVNSQEIDALLMKGRTTTKPEERQKIYEEFQKIAVEQAFWIPLYTAKSFYVVNNRVQGVKINSQLDLILQDSWVNE